MRNLQEMQHKKPLERRDVVSTCGEDRFGQAATVGAFECTGLARYPHRASQVHTHLQEKLNLCAYCGFIVIEQWRINWLRGERSVACPVHRRHVHR